MPELQKLQSPYWRNHSAKGAVKKVYNDLIIKKNRYNDSILVLVDLSATFNIVEQVLLFNVLFTFEIDDIILEWLRTYLRNRKFRVYVNDPLADECPMKTGVPHGRMLGPLLFLISTNEVHYFLEISGVFYYLYAD